jgi:hypothetical protein
MIDSEVFKMLRAVMSKRGYADTGAPDEWYVEMAAKLLDQLEDENKSLQDGSLTQHLLKERDLLRANIEALCNELEAQN